MNYFIYTLPSDQHNQCHIHAAHVGKVQCRTVEYASTLLYSDWLFLYGIVLNRFSDLLKNNWGKNCRLSIGTGIVL